MDSLPEDLLIIILAKLPLKWIATSKLVCKQWKSILESKILYQLFQSYHQNSHSFWSFMCPKAQKEVMTHYGCTYWDFTRPLGSYISSFMTMMKKRISWRQNQSVRVVDYSDVGLMLICLATPDAPHKTYYVANPISREYVEIPPPPCSNPTTLGTTGFVTQVENGVLSYKVVLIQYVRLYGSYVRSSETCLYVYSSETCLWSSYTIPVPVSFNPCQPISLNGNLYWIGFDKTLQDHVLVYHNFYATSMESDRCGVIPYPGVEKNYKVSNVYKNSQKKLMYMKLVFEDKDDGSSEYKVMVWRLKSGQWQLVSEVSTDFTKIGFDDVQSLRVYPFDAKTFYFWSNKQKCLAYLNLDKCEIGLVNNFKCSYDGCNLRISEDWDFWKSSSGLHMFVLPRWMYRIPGPPS